MMRDVAVNTENASVGDKQIPEDKHEEEALLNILEDVVAQGHHCDNGCFKPGTTLLIEKMLSNLCPTSNLKANPYIE